MYLPAFRFVISAVYLAVTLIMGVLSVIFSVLVLSLHHQSEADPPSWRLQLFVHYLSYIIRRQKTVNKISTVKQLNGPTKEVVEDITDKNMMAEYSSQKTVHETKASNIREDRPAYTWKEIAMIIDRFLLILFLIITSLLAIIFLSVLFA